ncbi:hypothetical protein [Streptomyces narbonensis]|uniref:hypothetical protein n=1 Tax=Streptomyces narbonensis TaxID=67333 RepID=UPI0033E7194C
MDIERRELNAWNVYGTHHLARGTDIPDVERLAWGYWPGHGPREEVLGDLVDRRVLDLCSGIGNFPTHFARRGIRVDAVEGARTQHERTVDRSVGALAPTLWEDLLVEHGLIAEVIDVLSGPDQDSPLSCTLVRASRPA